MTRPRRPEWKRPRVPCRPPAVLIERVGIWLAYSGVMSTWAWPVSGPEEEAPQNRVGPEEPSHPEPDWESTELRATASAIRPELAWWQRLLRYIGVERYG